MRTQQPENLNPNPTQKVLDDQAVQVLHWQKQQHEFIICIDANKITTKEGGMTKFIARTGLIDYLNSIHGPNTPRTYQREQRTIDIILVSQSIKDKEAASGYLPFGHTSISSGHRCLYVDFSEKLLFGNQQIVHAPPARIVSSKNKQQPEKLTIHLSKWLQDNQAIEKLQALEKDFNQDQLQKIDNILHEGMLHPNKNAPDVTHPHGLPSL